MPKTVDTSKLSKLGEPYPNTIRKDASQLVAFNHGLKPVRSQVGSKERRLHSARHITWSKSTRAAPSPQAHRENKSPVSTASQAHNAENTSPVTEPVAYNDGSDYNDSYSCGGSKSCGDDQGACDPEYASLSSAYEKEGEEKSPPKRRHSQRSTPNITDIRSARRAMHTAT